MTTKRPFSDDFRPDIRQWLVWIPTALGIGVLVGILVTFGHLAFEPPQTRAENLLPEPVEAVLPSMVPVATATGASVKPRPSPDPSADPPPDPTRTPHETTPTPSAHDSAGGSTSHPAKPPPAPPATPSPSKRPPTTNPTKTNPPPAAPLTGRYRVLNSWDDGFIGEVLVGNDSDQPHDWTVKLRFPDGVGRLYASWVSGAPDATLTREGNTYVWRSGVPVDGWSQVPLQFQFSNRPGSGTWPSLCTANGADCRS